MDGITSIIYTNEIILNADVPELLAPHQEHGGGRGEVAQEDQQGGHQHTHRHTIHFRLNSRIFKNSVRGFSVARNLVNSAYYLF